MSDEREWYFLRDEREWGPLTFDEIVEMVAANELPHSTPVRRRDTSEWLPFKDLHQSMVGQAEPVQGVLNYFAADDEATYAGFWLRLSAMIVDVAILLTAGMVVVITIDLIAQFASADWGSRKDLEVLGQLSWYVGAAFYYITFESSSWQATPGKRLIGLRVCDESGHRISSGRAAGRTLAKLISAALLYSGFIAVAFTQRKQGFHDMISGCVVLRRK